MKFKKIPKDYLELCFDRLTRFKHTREKYERVFSDVVNKFASKELEESIKTVEDLVNVAELIINDSTQKTNLYEAVKKIECEIFHQDAESEKFLNNKINFPYLPRKIEKVVLCEGATEEILLPILAKKCKIDFENIFILGAGGKNQVWRKYLKLLNEVKIPIFILLDCDAVEIKDAISSRLREIDDIYLIPNGEFEDILPKNLIIKALNFHFKDGHKCKEKDFDDNIKMSKNLEEIFKINGFGDFKKADFATMVKVFLEKNHYKMQKGIDFETLFCYIGRSPK